MWGFLARLTCGKAQTLTPLPAAAPRGKRAAAGSATDGDAAGADARRPERDQQAGAVGAPATPSGAVRAPQRQEMLPLTPPAAAGPAAHHACCATPATAECRTPAAAVGQQQAASVASSSGAPPRSGTGRLTSSGFLIEGGKTIGIPNTVSKFDPARPLPPTVTPFERRIERKLVAEAEALREQSAER
ncbi:hypothetical protein Rsub_03646 [Raphidocelis subcapitata]|uniref:Uncharacterized protein n=1 Tax=Raphidocelis subcapitata TaxID=307507 RepID=A0A2V0NUL0_9CHLO|nr:hypothetical protein Rsub_03646 [Raphidocelis subcapitata]|eukprot:GBF91326.1 hypothetical protein Rsub_03646 [Raphidocelis subcapitata]